MAKRKKRTTNLDHWLGSTVTPVFVIDAERQVRAFNAGCQALTGWKADDVVGQTCHYASVSDVAGGAALAASLCPPPEAFAGQESSTPAYLLHQHGHALPRMLHFFPLCDDKGRQTGVLGVISVLPPPAKGADVSPARQLHAELAALRMTLRSRFGPATLVARGIAMQRVLAQIEIAQNCQSPVLLTGAPGTGREHVARMIHFGGPAKGNSFVPLDCRQQAADEIARFWNRLLDSAPSPAGAVAAAGAQPGTVFLNDVECLPRDFQERLVLAFSSAAGSRPPVRLLASTSRSSTELVTVYHMRPDFHAFISPLLIELPRLSQREDDLPLLAQHFLEEHNRQQSSQVGGFDEQVWPLLTRYDWPGNLDELATVIDEARHQAAESLIRPHDLPFRFRTALAAQALPPTAEPSPLLLDRLLTKLETRLITLALKRSRNNKSKAADLLGINRARLLRRIEQLQIGADAASASPPEVELASDDEEALEQETKP